jgi:Zn-dependent protease
MPDPANALAFYVVFLFSTTLHEAAHAWAAKLGGDLTAYHGGQVTLDPRPHIKREPFGMVILPLLSVFLSGWPFGFASAPYDRAWAVNHPKRAAWMAIAGPGANLLLVLVSVLCIRLGVASGVFHAPQSVGFSRVVATEASGAWPAAAFVLSVFFSLNLVLAALNILPLPPLDGSAAIMLFMTARTAPRYQQFLWGNPMLQWVGMLIAWQVFGVVFSPVFLFAVNLVYPGLHYG